MFFQNPVLLAKRFATLDILSDGRTISGLGIGWSKDEYEVSGVPYKDKGSRADEFLQVLRKIWTDDVVEFKGQFYNIPASKIGPKPLQKPHPPILLGGFSPKTFSQKLCEWMDRCRWFWSIRAAGTGYKHFERKCKELIRTLQKLASTLVHIQMC
jgi:alkanesulfonate monooxygenase SsuD/methylene tetrahydromethanopterin reductase-like flavin-dependent oxidoreductase (luciferase family)